MHSNGIKSCSTSYSMIKPLHSSFAFYGGIQRAVPLAGIIEVRSLQDIDDLMSKLDHDGVLVLKFFASWCGPCKAIQEQFLQIAKDYSIPRRSVFATVDIDRNFVGNMECE